MSLHSFSPVPPLALSSNRIAGCQRLPFTHSFSFLCSVAKVKFTTLCEPALSEFNAAQNTALLAAVLVLLVRYSFQFTPVCYENMSS